MTARGQALVELAVCMPIVLLLGLGAAGVVEVADAQSGLEAAAEAAASAAARAPSATAAGTAAAARFRDVVAAYPLRSAYLAVADGTFQRGTLITATATGDVDLAWESMSFLPAVVHLRATATAESEPWRSR